MTDQLRARLPGCANSKALPPIQSIQQLGGLRLGHSSGTAAGETNLAIAIDIRRNGHQLCHAARPGTSANNDAWIVRKVRLVADRCSVLDGIRPRRSWLWPSKIRRATS